MDLILLATVALFASFLTFFSGFGLGTLLLPAFVLFFDPPVAVALTAIVHFANNLFKLSLVGKFADRAAVFRFGVPALAAAFVGSGLLVTLAQAEGWVTYTLAGREFSITPLKLTIGVLMLGFASMDLLPRLRKIEIPTKYLPLGGLLSGFFGGLSGHQGALRSAFLIKCGLSREGFIATGVVIACMVDLARLAVYTDSFLALQWREHGLLLTAAVTAALGGALAGRWLLPKVTLPGIQYLVGALLLLVSLGLMSGLI